MSKNTRTYVTVYEFGEKDLARLDTAVNLETDQFFEDVVPFKHEWGNTAYMELEDLEYTSHNQQLTFTCETKWEAPVGWLKAATVSPYFEGKLLVAATITRDESYVEGYAFMNHDLLQEKTLVDVEPSLIGEMYANDEVDEIDDLLWGPIEKFSQDCEDFYIAEFPCAGV